MIELSNANTEKLILEELTLNQTEAYVLRLDKIHPVVSGNKWFKLKYHLEEAVRQAASTILTFGGAFSNHIIATAFAAREAGFRSAGVIRGEEPPSLSPTLSAAQGYGMQLFFVSREVYNDKNTAMLNAFNNNQGKVYIIPEGGAGWPGEKGSEEILPLASGINYTHVLCCIGTGTMFKGLLNRTESNQELIGIPVLKGLNAENTSTFLGMAPDLEQGRYRLFYQYHFGGYAKKTPPLLEFMNSFYIKTGIPSDFVYTGKLFYAFTDLLNNGYFKPGSKVLIIHSGGLQGNNSLSEGMLRF